MQEFFNTENQAFTSWIYQMWGIRIRGLDPDAQIQGSPERTVSRAVILDSEDRRFLIEKFSPSKQRLRQNVAAAVSYLNNNGLDQALGSLSASSGTFLPRFGDGCFQVSKFLDSTGIQRPDYLRSAEVGKNFARFIIRLSRSCIGLTDQISFDGFSIKSYTYSLFKRMHRHDPDVYRLFLPVLAFLEESFMRRHDQIPVRYCHGDLHPLNVIWKGDVIRAVIDWEFTGIKPDIYDLANLVGCAGIEDPSGLGQEMVMTLIRTLRRQDVFSEVGWALFPEYLIALRFAWLSEWLRNKDRQMIETEYAYMTLLKDNIDTIRKGWNISTI